MYTSCMAWSGTSWYRNVGATGTIVCSYLPVCVDDWASVVQFCKEEGYYNGYRNPDDGEESLCMRYSGSSWIFSEGIAGSVNCYPNIGRGYSQNVAFTLNGETYAYNCSRDGVCVEDFSSTPLCGFGTALGPDGLYIDPDCGVHTWQTCGRFQLRSGAIGEDCNPVDNRGYNAHTQCVDPTDCVYFNSTNNVYQCIPEGGMIPVPNTNNGYIVCNAGVNYGGNRVNAFCPEEYEWYDGSLSGTVGFCRYPPNRCASVCQEVLFFSSSLEFNTLCFGNIWANSSLHPQCSGETTNPLTGDSMRCPTVSECLYSERNFVHNWRCFVNNTDEKFYRYCGPVVSYPEYQFDNVLDVHTV